MNSPGFNEKIEAVLKDSSIDSCNAFLEEVQALMEKTEDEAALAQLEFLEKRLNIHLLEIERDALAEDKFKEKIHLNGKIARAYKKASNDAPNHPDRLKMRHEHLECLKMQKELLHSYRTNPGQKISIPEKLAL